MLIVDDTATAMTRALELMKEALAVLDQAGATLEACYLQLAVDAVQEISC